jgi:6-phosphogluconolactonase
MIVNRYPSPQVAAENCAAYILQRLKSAIAGKGSASLAISGGSSPRLMFQIFARASFDWNSVHLFWVDERAVPPTDSQSNYKLAFDNWLQPANFPERNVHRVVTELGHDEAARHYQSDIRQYFRLADGEMAKLDVIHRGMGPDGHTASLFPGEPLIQDHHEIAAAVWVQKMNQWRITLLPGVLEAARNTAMLVTGEDKAAVLREVLEGPYRPVEYPCQIAAQAETTAWFSDEAASRTLAGA